MQPKRGEGGVEVSFVKLCFGWLGLGKIEAILFVRFRERQLIKKLAYLVLAFLLCNLK